MTTGDEKLRSLADTQAPEATAAARRRALDMAMSAFDDEQAKKFSTPPQGENWAERLRSIVQPNRGNWIMDTRIGLGLGTAAVALLLLPLGYQLYTSTALTPVEVAPVPANRPAVVESQERETSVNTPTPLVEDDLVRADGPDEDTGSTAVVDAAPVPPGEPVLVAPPQVRKEAADLELARGVQQQAKTTVGTAPSRPPEPMLAAESGSVASGNATAGRIAASPPQMAMDAAVSPPQVLALPSPSTATASASNQVSGGNYRGPVPAPNPATTEPSGDEFTQFEESPVKLVAEAPVSTFSIDVDTASYTYARRALENGWLPEPDSVRIEEMINYFSYNYAGPDGAEAPFATTTSLFPAPWNPERQLLHIGIKGFEPPAGEDRASNLVFLLDTSGSMNEPDKLPLLKRAFSLLVDQLTDNDTVSIVVYAGSAGVVLEPTPATDKAKILDALGRLEAGGSTAGAAGIELAYRMAEQAKIDGGINRVILATDGDFNVGIDDPDDLENYIRQKRDTGVSLSVLGFGQGNLGDDTMQALAQNGNGNASYIDSFREAQRVLVAEGGGTLETIAKDVKIQIEFNPAFVSEYRLIGYETRALNREDFNNDKVDAGDIGAGHAVTAIYELTMAGSQSGLIEPLRYGQGSETTVSAPIGTDELAFLKLRYKLPEEDVSKLIEAPVTRAMSVDAIGSASVDQRWAAAVAAFAQKLKGSNYGEMSWNEIRALAQGARGADEDGYRAEFMQLIDSARTLDPNG